MIKVTTRLLSSIMLESFGKITTYIGRSVERDYSLTRPIKFAFFEWDEDRKMKGVVMIQEAHILQLIKEKNEK